MQRQKYNCNPSGKGDSNFVKILVFLGCKDMNKCGSSQDLLSTRTEIFFEDLT